LFGERLISLPFSDFGGPCVKDGNEVVINELLKEASSLAEDLGADYVEIRGDAETPSAHFENLGYRRNLKYCTFALYLARPLDEIWGEFKKEVRNAVRKAEKNNLRRVDVLNRSNLRKYYELYLQTTKRLGSPPHSLKFFERMWNALYTENLVKILLAEHKGQHVGGIILLKYGKGIYFWGSVLPEKFRYLNPTNYLLWQAIQEGRQNGYEVFNFGRTRPGTGVYWFKAGWSGAEVELPHYYWFNGVKEESMPDPEEPRYKFLSKVWGLIPTFIARRLGPKVIGGIGL